MEIPSPTRRFPAGPALRVIRQRAVQAASVVLLVSMACFAIIQSLPGDIAVPLLEGIGVAPLFGAVVHAGVCRARKPSPKPLLVAYERLGVEPAAEDMYVGDRPDDSGAASAAGIRFGWASWGYGPDADYEIKLQRPEDLLDA